MSRSPTTPHHHAYDKTLKFEWERFVHLEEYTQRDFRGTEGEFYTHPSPFRLTVFLPYRGRSLGLSSWVPLSPN